MKVKRPEPQGTCYKKNPLLCQGFGVGFWFDTGIGGRGERGGVQRRHSRLQRVCHFCLAETELILECLNQVMEGCVHCAAAPDKKEER